MTSAEDRDALAAEYVLGTLDSVERAQAGVLIESDPGFAALVRGWERRLGELHAMVEPVEPPTELWDRIKSSLDGTASAPMRLPALPQDARDRAVGPGEPRVNVIPLVRRLSRWRAAAIATGALAAVLAALIVAAAIMPDLLPARMRQSRTAEAPALGRFVAVLQREGASPAFILTVDVAHRSFTVRRVADPEPGKSFELWLISNRSPQPRSLGVVDGEFTPPRTLAGLDPATISNATYAVSLEPEGGSPTGEPTGPVVFQGRLIEAMPEASPLP
ncbi:MAG TPA: anti-sigma factor [Xanthobacteraceae bacterium]|nr:anti-sigma factor [Xanthobacteraceae bacterium]